MPKSVYLLDGELLLMIMYLFGGTITLSIIVTGLIAFMVSALIIGLVFVFLMTSVREEGNKHD